jgi:type III secretory pathway lipoprotein EscJ
MAKLLFRLTQVPDDEANDIRELLSTHNLDCYETEEGRWRVGIAAIWLKDETRFAEARALIDAYQQQRYANSQQNLATQDKLPFLQQLWLQLASHPLQFIMAVIALLFVLLVSLAPFLLI